MLKTAEDGHGAVCRVLDNYYYPGEEESAKAWNSTLYIYMGVGEGDDKGSGPRQWEMYLALDDTFLRFVKVILSAGGHVRREPLEVAGQMHARLMQYTMT